MFPRLNIRLNGYNFDTTEVTEAETQAVLNALTEHDFQDAFKKWKQHWEQCIRAEWEYFEGDVASGPEVSSIPDCSTPKNMDGSLYI
jgi:hypothetical protein